MSAAGGCHRCAAAGQRGTSTTTSAPYWDPAYRMCGPCLAAVGYLLDATGTRPEPAGDGWTFPAHAAHTGAPHFLWNPDKRGLAAQIADGGTAACPSPVPAASRAGVGDPRTRSGQLSAPEGGVS